MMIAKEQLPTIRGTYRERVPLAKTTWFQVGGEADIVFRPEDTEDLAYFIQHKPQNVPVLCLGVGSNVIVRDGGVEGVVIKLGRFFSRIEVQGTNISVGAGALDYNVAMVAKDHGIAGLEFLSGIPGTIGGALAMNAGAYGGDIASILIEAEAVTDAGDIITLRPEDIGFVYRGNTLPEGIIFTKAILRGQTGDKQEIAQKIQEIQDKRAETQPIKERTGGSTFKNPQEISAWKLVDQAGCRGLEKGGAKISEKHCNFMLNIGNATADDLEGLGDEVIQRVKDQTGVTLQWEIKRLGKRSQQNDAINNQS